MPAQGLPLSTMFMHGRIIVIWCRFSFVAHLAEHTGGLSYARSIDTLLDQAENDWPAMRARLERLRATILARNKRTVVNLTAGDKILSSVDGVVNAFLESLPAAASTERLDYFDIHC